ncbi:MAG: hypothetical protein WCK35_28415 [Chloroflexota bacterium]
MTAQNYLGDTCINTLRDLGVGRVYRHSGEPFNIFFWKPAPPNIQARSFKIAHYSRLDAIQPDMNDWKAALASVDWLHWMSITQAVTKCTTKFSTKPHWRRVN